MNTEVRKIIEEILVAHKALFPMDDWVTFRREYLQFTEEYSDKDLMYTGDDYTNDKICSELDAAIEELPNKITKRMFGYNKKQKPLRCPTCLERRNGDDEWSFAQIQRNDQIIRCAACLSTFNFGEYKTKIIDYFGYLGEIEQHEIEKELDESIDK